MNLIIKSWFFVGAIASFMNVSPALPSLSMVISNMTAEQSQQLGDVGNNLVLFEGDIVFNDSVGKIDRNAVWSRDRIWPRATVYYKINSEFSGWRRDYIHKAMQKISLVSCVRFQEATSDTKAYVKFISHPQFCTSEVGFKKRIQYIKLALDNKDEGCFRVGSILHELMHTLGFYHQHNVPDRNNHVRIYTKNMHKSERVYFNQLDRVFNFSLPYDFGSIMHYSLYANSENGRETILPMYDPGEVYYQIGQRTRLSPIDIKKINMLYNCC